MGAKERAAAVVSRLRRLGSRKARDGMARYAIPSTNAFGMSMATMQKVAKELGQDHALALALWETGFYEARTVAAFVADPQQLTPAQMDRWCRDFDSWAICDTVCFKLFDRTQHAFAKVRAWSKLRDEFQKRAAFALLASLALHDKKSPPEPFLRTLPLIERAATDDRNFVKKGVSWALRGIGRRDASLHEAALALARMLAASDVPSARWIGKDAARELERVRPKTSRALRRA